MHDPADHTTIIDARHTTWLVRQQGRQRRETHEHLRCPFMRFNAIDHLEARVLTEKALEHISSYAYAWANLGFTDYTWIGRKL
jgi:hypothetical protein